MPHLLTKSDFKAAQTCPTKLYYRKLKYPNNLDSNKLLKLLAEGGYVVEEIARLMYPGGIEIDYAAGHDVAAKQTAEAMKNENVVIYEATFIAHGKLIRVDILNKVGNRIEIIEVKAKSWDSAGNRARLEAGKPNAFRNIRSPEKIVTKWIPYIEDVAFQYALIREMYPDATIESFLMMPDKSKTSTTNVLYQHFKLMKDIDPETGRTAYTVRYTGDADSLRNENILALVNVQEEVELVLPSVLEQTSTYMASLQPLLSRIDAPVTTSCAKCEFRVDGDQSGFRECWSKYGNQEPHILDLYYSGNANPVKQLIEDGKAGLFDLKESDLANPTGENSSNVRRQIIQLNNTRSGTEWISPELNDIVRSVKYPLHFIDFETSGLAVPYYSNMKPYENVAFQWSCHSITSPGSEPEHSEWLNDFHDFPSFEFARTLRQQIGDEGTVLAWAPHEKNILKTILKQMKVRRTEDPILELWIEDLVENRKSRLLDMHRLCFDHYFHPLMKGKTSIKNVCDAVWRTSAMIRSRFPEYDTGGSTDSPYNSLPSVDIDGVDETIAEGAGAMIAYGKMLYGGETSSEENRAKWRDLLLQYCKLDTAAMVMIWYHWAGDQQFSGQYKMF